ncbi:EAL domain-containing protein [Roseospira marina]|uniref:EAL domain-containing protein n=1 Tax=Roseospira marina TaxID=140057 RepID=A0A5M6IFC7_9PROT|nr:EAL domain-containing protein [Roseospira marina]KAA5606980.1 EAL domain-containing protein [Roseospira marina]MBB4312840.1 EAL domain-containing protein (putative c-di-GMP-specific phosphodiesterase class I) [Roseospira marina]MBB5086387.1 EAL domain-containing protein (putative c-di-GMP-specific phosphodiesterase class I) [Roseospira marina]
MTAQDCARCGRVPAAPTGQGRLFLWPPLGHTAGKLRRALAASPALRPPEMVDGALVIPVGDRDHLALARVLEDALTRAECQDTRALFLADGERPDRRHLGEVGALETYVARTRGHWLLEVMAAERVTMLFQPIFHVAEPTRVFAHECLLRGVDSDGGLIPPKDMFDFASRADLTFPLDRLARIAAVKTAAARQVPGHIFINFTPSAIYDPDYCLRTTLDAVEQTGLDRGRVVFEVIETDRIGDPEHLAGVLRYYRDAGFKVALDDLGGGYGSLGLLPSLRPDFVKLDRAIVDGVHAHPVKGVVVQRLVEMAHDLDIQVVAEGVEQAEDLTWLQACGADFVQGFLLAAPAPEPIRPGA